MGKVHGHTVNAASRAMDFGQISTEGFIAVVDGRASVEQARVDYPEFVAGQVVKVIGGGREVVASVEAPKRNGHVTLTFESGGQQPHYMARKVDPAAAENHDAAKAEADAIYNQVDGFADERGMPEGTARRLFAAHGQARVDAIDAYVGYLHFSKRHDGRRVLRDAINKYHAARLLESTLRYHVDPAPAQVVEPVGDAHYTDGDVEYVVEATWVKYGGTDAERREVVEMRVGSEEQGNAEAARIRRDYSTPDYRRADAQYVERVFCRVDPIVYDRTPEVDTILDTIAAAEYLNPVG